MRKHKTPRARRLWLAIIFLLIFSKSLYAEPAIWKVLLAEAGNQKAIGMKAVACVIRNRGGSLKGFCGAKRKDLNQFCQRQGKYWIKIAKQIEREVFEQNCSDVTKGATHFENLNAFPQPYWAKDMRITAIIKDHTFYKER